MKQRVRLEFKWIICHSQKSMLEWHDRLWGLESAECKVKTRKLSVAKGCVL